MKEGVNKKLVSITRVRMVEGKLAESRYPDSLREMETKKTEIAMCYCINSDLVRVGEEW